MYFVLGAIFLTASILIFRKNSKNRKDHDKLVPQHKHSLKSPTWRFQKFHPSKCPHHNGIYREIFAESIKKTIFVCADCVDIIEVDEIKHRDKFK